MTTEPESRSDSPDLAGIMDTITETGEFVDVEIEESGHVYYKHEQTMPNGTTFISRAAPNWRENPQFASLTMVEFFLGDMVVTTASVTPENVVTSMLTGSLPRLSLDHESRESFVRAIHTPESLDVTGRRAGTLALRMQTLFDSQDS